MRWFLTQAGAEQLLPKPSLPPSLYKPLPSTQPWSPRQTIVCKLLHPFRLQVLKWYIIYA